MTSEMIEHFICACETKGFSVAAKRLNISQQGLSQSIKKLETELGLTLFLRSQKGIELTGHGEFVLPLLKNIHNGYLTLQNELKDYISSYHEQLKIGFAYGSLPFLTYDFIDGFRKRYPNIDLSYTDYICDDMLKQGTINLGFSVSPYNKDRFIGYPMVSQPFCLMVSSDDPLALRKNLFLKDLEGLPIACAGSEFKAYHTMLRECRNLGFEPEIVLTSSEVRSLYLPVEKKRCYAPAIQSIADDICKQSSVKAIPIICENFKWSLSLLQLKNSPQSFAEKCFIAYFREFMQNKSGEPVEIV